MYIFEDKEEVRARILEIDRVVIAKSRQDPVEIYQVRRKKQWS